MSLSTPLQRTLAQTVETEGVGLHTGHLIRLRILPAEAHSGIQLFRSDLPCEDPVQAHWSHVFTANSLNTTLGRQGCSISTVEHLLSALRGCGIDNAKIEVEGPEIPILDGSAQPFAEAFAKVGLVEQQAPRLIGRLSAPLTYTDKEITLVALPADELRLSYTLHYPEHPLLQAQFHSQTITADTYRSACAPSRTFTLLQEVEILRARGLIRGGSLENAVVIDGDKILNPEGLRMVNEMACHKVLDLLGDLSLVGGFFHAHIIALRSGHATNVVFARQLASALMWS